PGGKLNGVELDKPHPNSNPEAFRCPCLKVQTDANGYATDASYSKTPPGTIKFEPPRAGTWLYAKYGGYEIGIAGTYEITARPTRFPNNKKKAPINVAKQPQLQPLEHSGAYFVCCPNEIEPHKLSNYGTPGTLLAFKSL